MERNEKNKENGGLELQIRTPDKKLLIGEIVNKKGSFYLLVKCRGKIDSISIEEIENIFDMYCRK